MVVSSNENYLYVPFLPDDPKTTRCICVAFHHYGAGHYDASTSLKGQYTLCDVLMNVCAHILKVPIMVVTSNENYPYVPFLPSDEKTTRCKCVAFNYYGAEHYDATTSLKGQYTVYFEFLRLAL